MGRLALGALVSYVAFTLAAPTPQSPSGGGSGTSHNAPVGSPILYEINDITASTGYSLNQLSLDFQFQGNQSGALEYQCSVDIPLEASSQILTYLLQCDGTSADPNPGRRTPYYFQGAVVVSSIDGNILKFGQKGYPYAEFQIGNWSQWPLTNNTGNTSIKQYQAPGLPVQVTSNVTVNT